MYVHPTRPLFAACIAVLLSLSFGVFFPTDYAAAADSDRLSGWAWSDNIGWISLNCTNTNSCDTVEYGVNLSGSGSTLSASGWAWSDNIGWINFDEVSLTDADKSLHGTALAYNTLNEPYCNGSDPYQTNDSGTIGSAGGTYDCDDDANDDGWDGVISLSGSSPNYGPVADATDDTADTWDWNDDSFYLLDGYAWGGTNIGWIKFSCQDSDGAGGDTNTCNSVGYGVYLDPFFMEFSASEGLTKAGQVDYEGSFNHTWTLIPDSDISSCTGSGGPGTWSDSPSKATSPSPLSELVENATSSATSTLSCVNSDNKTITRDLFVYVKPPPPSINFTADDYNIPYNGSTALYWTTENIASCTASGGDSGWTGSIATGTDRTYNTDNLTSQTTTYNMSCESMYPDDYSTVLATLDVEVQTLTLDFYATDENGDRITDQDELQSYTKKDSIDLNWETEFATQGCVASGDWSGTKVAADPNNDIVDGSETASTSAAGSYSYTLTCDGEFNQQQIQSISLQLSRNPGFSEEITNQLE
jgi:hypothetical protein